LKASVEPWRGAFYATSLTSPPPLAYAFPSQPFYTQWEYVFNSTVYDAHIQDVFKSMRSWRSRPFQDRGNYYRRRALRRFQVELYLLDSDSWNLRPRLIDLWQAHPAAVRRELQVRHHNDSLGRLLQRALVCPWRLWLRHLALGTTQAGFDALRTSTHPETSWTKKALPFHHAARRGPGQLLSRQLQQPSAGLRSRRRDRRKCFDSLQRGAT